MKTKCCPTCGQQWPENIRYGVRLAPKQLALFDKIERRPGITQRELRQEIWNGEPLHKTTISVHVANINDLFAHTDLYIRGRAYSGYTMHVPAGLKR